MHTRPLVLLLLLLHPLYCPFLNFQTKVKIFTDLDTFPVSAVILFALIAGVRTRHEFGELVSGCVCVCGGGLRFKMPNAVVERTPPFLLKVYPVTHPTRLSNGVARLAYVGKIRSWKRGHCSSNPKKKKKKSQHATEKSPPVVQSDTETGHFLVIVSEVKAGLNMYRSRSAFSYTFVTSQLIIYWLKNLYAMWESSAEVNRLCKVEMWQDPTKAQLKGANTKGLFALQMIRE